MVEKYPWWNGKQKKLADEAKQFADENRRSRWNITSGSWTGWIRTWSYPLFLENKLKRR